MNRAVLSALALLASLQLANAADITGKITLNGKPPAETPLPFDPTCGKFHPNGDTTHFYRVGPGGELADVFVYIKDGLTGKTFEVPSKPGLLDQKGCEYMPYISGLQARQKLMVKNSDPVLHNVHPTPVVPGNKEANKAQLPNSPELEFVFEKPEVLLRIKCDVHPWMFAFVGVVDHPYYSVSSEDGAFKIANVPAGKYTIEAYHRKAGKQTQEVTVGNESQPVNFKFDVK